MSKGKFQINCIMSKRMCSWQNNSFLVKGNEFPVKGNNFLSKCMISSQRELFHVKGNNFMSKKLFPVEGNDFL